MPLLSRAKRAVLMACADVMAVWSFGAGVVEGSGEVERRQGGVELLEER